MPRTKWLAAFSLSQICFSSQDSRPVYSKHLGSSFGNRHGGESCRSRSGGHRQRSGNAAGDHHERVPLPAYQHASNNPAVFVDVVSNLQRPSRAARKLLVQIGDLSGLPQKSMPFVWISPSPILRTSHHQPSVVDAAAIADPIHRFQVSDRASTVSEGAERPITGVRRTGHLAEIVDCDSIAVGPAQCAKVGDDSAAVGI